MYLHFWHKAIKQHWSAVYNVCMYIYLYLYIYLFLDFGGIRSIQTIKQNWKLFQDRKTPSKYRSYEKHVLYKFCQKSLGYFRLFQTKRELCCRRHPKRCRIHKSHVLEMWRGENEVMTGSMLNCWLNCWPLKSSSESNSHF